VGRQRVQGAQHFVCRRVTRIPILLERLEDDGLELGRKAGHDLARRKYAFFRTDIVHGRRFGFATKRVLSGGQRVEHDAQGEDVRTTVQAIAEHLLGSHVTDLALDLARRGGAAAQRGGFGHAEVHDLGHAIEGDQQVLRRHVAVNQAYQLASLVPQFVSCVQPGTGVHGDAGGDGGGHAPGTLGGLHQQIEGHTLDPLHDQVEDAVLLAEVERLDGVRVTDLRRELRFVQKHLLELSFFTQLGQHRLDGDDLLKLPRAAEPRRPDLRHAARRDRYEQFVPAQHATGA
jgi:hypothetical protein